jgi:TatD DNase family protein
VERIYLPNIDETSLLDLNNLVSKDPSFFKAMIGLHPTSVKDNYLKVFDEIFNDADLSSYCAIGEIGIDLFWDKTHIKEQIEIFERQIELAKANKLPIVIHARDSFDEIFEVIDRQNSDDLSGIFHCFTGTLQDARHIINYGGFKLGIGGIVTFKNGGLDKILPEISPEHLVLETDSPYLAPTPNRGKRNESAYIREIANRVAEIYGMSIEEVSAITTANALKIFEG